MEVKDPLDAVNTGRTGDDWCARVRPNAVADVLPRCSSRGLT